MIRTGLEIKDVCFVQHAEKQLILCVHVNAIGAYAFLTGEKLWQKKHGATISLRPGGITTNSHSFVLAPWNGKQQCIQMLFTDGSFIGTLMNISDPWFLAWIKKTSHLVVIHCKGNQWFVTALKVEPFTNRSNETGI